ncbi:MAG: IS1595 family transposase [Nitrospira sp.]|nr:IS1595 family transposase [Nitrospira sp.]
MYMANRYIFHSRISEAKFRYIVRLFALDLNAVQIAALTGLSRVSINRHLAALRRRMAWHCDQDKPVSGDIEVDESSFGAGRVRGRRRRRAFGKTAVFGLFNRHGQVSTEIVPDCQKATLQAIIRGRVGLDSVLSSDGWRGYDGLVDVGYGRPFKVTRGRDEFVRGAVHTNSIDGFWSFAKSRLAKFRGMNKKLFYLHLKECEFRFNHRHNGIYQILLKSCRGNPIELS